MHAGHAMRHASAPMSLGGLLGSWAAMVIAMMLPLVRHQARWLAFRSLRARRQQAVAVFSGAYFAVWMTAGAVALVVLGPVRGEPAALALALAVAACWHCAASRRRLLLRCGVQRASPRSTAARRSPTGLAPDRSPAGAASRRAGR
jgi:predicted metal-binding membrane protein